MAHSIHKDGSRPFPFKVPQDRGFGRSLSARARGRQASPTDRAAISPSPSLVWTALALAVGVLLLIRRRRRSARTAPNDELQVPLYGPFLTEIEIRRDISEIASRGRDDSDRDLTSPADGNQ